jgi:hypothetical protein
MIRLFKPHIQGGAAQQTAAQALLAGQQAQVHKMQPHVRQQRDELRIQTSESKVAV